MLSRDANPLLPTVTGLWQQVLESSDFTADTHFFLAGGDSLQLTRVMLKLQQACGVQLQLQDIVEFSTPRKMAEWCEHLLGRAQEQKLSAGNELATGYENGDQRTAYPASPMQQGLWLAEQRAEHLALYNTAALLHLHGKLDLVVLEQALSVLLQKHPVLRTALAFDLGSRTLLGKVTPFQPVFLRAEPINAACLATRASELASLPFAMHTRMYLFHLFRVTNNHHALLLVVHHALTDLWSAGVMMQSLAEAYNKLRTDAAWQARDIDVGFLDHCHQLAGITDAARDTRLGWWRQHLCQLPVHDATVVCQAQAAMNTKWPFAVRCWQAVLPSVMLDVARRICRRQQVTLFSCMFAAFKLALADLTATGQQTVGFPVASRSSVSHEHSVGCFVNTLLTRDLVGGDATPANLLRQTHTNVQGALSHALPLPELITQLRPLPLPSGNVWFDVLFAFQNLPQGALCFDGLFTQIESVAPLCSQYSLKVEVLPAVEQWQLRVEYAEQVFVEADVTRLVQLMHSHLYRMGR